MAEPTQTVVAVAVPRMPTHDECYQLFHQVLGALEATGWRKLRVDTWQRDSDSGDKQAWVVRHHYDAGTWELYFEPDRYWNAGPHPEARLARIRKNRAPLPLAAQVLSELFGPRLREFFPAFTQSHV